MATSNRLTVVLHLKDTVNRHHSKATINNSLLSRVSTALLHHSKAMERPLQGNTVGPHRIRTVRLLQDSMARLHHNRATGHLLQVNTELLHRSKAMGHLHHNMATGHLPLVNMELLPHSRATAHLRQDNMELPRHKASMAYPRTTHQVYHHQDSTHIRSQQRHNLSLARPRRHRSAMGPSKLRTST